MIFSKILNKHLHHLHQIFSLFQKLEISLELKKFYLKYLTVILLNQWIDVLELIITAKKIQAITDLQFSWTLKMFKIYFDLMKWLCFYIFYYAQITVSLQIHKTMLSKTSPALKENAWKQYISCTSIKDFSFEKLCAFETLQNLFTKLIFLCHFDSSWQLYINVNVFKQYEFDAVIYHIESNSIMNSSGKAAEFPHQKIQSIFFLNKLLTSAEKNYWFMKMETADLIWIIWKTKHLIKSVLSKLTAIVFINYFVIIFIAWQIHLIMTILINKLNLWLVQMS